MLVRGGALELATYIHIHKWGACAPSYMLQLILKSFNLYDCMFIAIGNKIPK